MWSNVSENNKVPMEVTQDIALPKLRSFMLVYACTLKRGAAETHTSCPYK